MYMHFNLHILIHHLVTFSHLSFTHLASMAHVAHIFMRFYVHTHVHTTHVHTTSLQLHEHDREHTRMCKRIHWCARVHSQAQARLQAHTNTCMIMLTNGHVHTHPAQMHARIRIRTHAHKRTCVHRSRAAAACPLRATTHAAATNILRVPCACAGGLVAIGAAGACGCSPASSQGHARLWGFGRQQRARRGRRRQRGGRHA